MKLATASTGALELFPFYAALSEGEKLRKRNHFDCDSGAKSSSFKDD